MHFSSNSKVVENLTTTLTFNFLLKCPIVHTMIALLCATYKIIVTDAWYYSIIEMCKWLLHITEVVGNEKACRKKNITYHSSEFVICKPFSQLMFWYYNQYYFLICVSIKNECELAGVNWGFKAD